MQEKEKNANRLIHESSPYLLQHAYNPVAWYPWGEEAFEKARRENLPVFLSIGYSSCHWCHVMERESFENEDIAVLLNEAFVPVKVDREERPDLDKLYMTYVQAATGQGGWPMSVWLTPHLEPFFGGSYFPPEDRHGVPGFTSILQSIVRAWHQDSQRLTEAAEEMTDRLRLLSKKRPLPVAELSEEGIEDAVAEFREGFDREFGGFGSAPKFPRPAVLDFLLAHAFYTGNEESRNMALFTLDSMAAGGIHDQLGIPGKGGGGFARYSTDRWWRLPHFEKMLYDNAQLATTCTNAFKATGERRYLDLAGDILNYVLCDLADKDGGFHSAEDADSFPRPGAAAKEEGGYYTWSYDELAEVLEPRQLELFCRVHGVRPEGNVLSDPQGEFASRNVLIRTESVREAASLAGVPGEKAQALLDEARRTVFDARLRRPKPDRDDKVLVSWNGLMISALATAAAATGNREWLDAAKKAADFILNRLCNPEEGRLLRRYRKGKAGIDGKADDYAFFAQGLLDLYEASFETRFLDKGVRIMEKQIELFFDRESGGFFTSAYDDRSVPVRMKEDYDGAEPSPNSVNVVTLYRLAEMTGREEFRTVADKTLDYFNSALVTGGQQLPCMLQGAMMALFGTRRIGLSGHGENETTNSMKRALERLYLPDTVVVADRQTHDEPPAAILCANNSCLPPAEDVAGLLDALEKTAPSSGKRDGS